MKYQPNHSYNIEHLTMLSQQLQDISKDYNILLNKVRAYKDENTQLRQQITKLQLLLNHNI